MDYRLRIKELINHLKDIDDGTDRLNLENARYMLVQCECIGAVLQGFMFSETAPGKGKADAAS